MQQPTSAPGGPAAGARWDQVLSYQPGAPSPANVTRRPLIRRILLWSAVLAVFGLGALVLAVVLSAEIGLTTAALALAASSVALGIVIPLFLWVDRLEAEPPRLLWFAFLWGALVSTVGAMLLNELGVAFFAGFHEDPQVVGAVIVAPVTEELLKGLGVLLIFWTARREFHGITDGIVYAGLVAAGFALVENILYLGSIFVEAGTAGLVALFIARVLISPFAHPMFTVCIGLALGIVTNRRRGPVSVLIVLLGYAAAVGLHALWNYGAVAGFLPLYVMVQIPLFLGFLAMLIWARRRESRILRDTLTGYGLNGWYTPAEVAMIADHAERRRARQWARRVGGRPGERAMRAFQDESGELAMVRKHLNQFGPEVPWLVRERALLDTVTAHRKVFLPEV